MKLRSIASLCLAMSAGLALAQGAPLNQPLDVYVARFNVLADQMDSPLNLNSKGIQPKKDSSGEVLVVPASRSVNVIFKLSSGAGNVESIGGAFATDGGMQAALDAAAATQLVAMAIFNRPKTKGVGALSSKLCSDAVKNVGIEKYGAIDNVKIGCLAQATGGILMKISGK
jgi:hypothetical protein